nr:ribonuclease H-like domain-containing protein [Tanacetum cinerariifolium]
FMRPFGYPVTILNTLDSLGKFKGKVDEGISNLDTLSAQSKKQEDKTKKEAKGKSPVESFTRYRDLSAEFEDCSNNIINEDNAADDYNRFTWVFFLATKDETSPILKTFITGLENQLSLKNRVLVTKPHNKTPYELLHGRTPSIGFMRPFGYPVTILNTLDSLGKFKGKNNNGDAAFDGKEHDFDAKKPESEVSVSPSSSAQSKKQEDKTKKEAKGKSPVESFTRYRDLSAEFEDCSNNSINEDNAADASQLPDGPDMPELEDITYSDEELLQFKMKKVGLGSRGTWGVRVKLGSVCVRMGCRIIA